jgi:hypothetical protein
MWASAGRADRFWVSEWQQPPADETLVAVLYDDTALYLAFTCYDTRPDLVRAGQLARDGAPGLDDRVTVELDPFHNHRSISRFTVTARGTQSDAMSGGRARKIEWKGNWRAAARKTSFGWTAEVAIPFEILDFDPDAEVFGINFTRYQNRTQQWSEWANLTPQRLAEQAGHLTGLRLPADTAPRRLTVLQYASGGMQRAGALASPSPRVTTGISLRHESSSRLTTVLSANPDFSTTETDVNDLAFSYNEKYQSDRRPFFQEGSGFWGDQSVFHSGRVRDFDVGVKSFGRMAAYQVGVLAVSDFASHRTDYAGRLLREFGSTFNTSITLVGTDREHFDNNVVHLQAGGRLGRHITVDGQAAHSVTRGASGDGSRARGAFAYQTPHWYSGVWADQTEATFLPANAYIAADLLGTSGRGAYGGYNRGFASGWIRRANASVAYETRDILAGPPQRETTSIYASAETSSHLQFTAGTTVGSYRPGASGIGQWLDTLNHDRFHLASAYYQSPGGGFGYGAHYAWGFLGGADYQNVAPTLWLSPSSHLSVAYSFERAAYDSVQHQHVLSGTWAMTETQAVSARWVQHDGGAYRVSYRRAVARGVDTFAVYTHDREDPGSLNVKLVWTLLPFSVN